MKKAYLYIGVFLAIIGGLKTSDFVLDTFFAPKTLIASFSTDCKLDDGTAGELFIKRTDKKGIIEYNVGWYLGSDDNKSADFDSEHGVFHPDKMGIGDSLKGYSVQLLPESLDDYTALFTLPINGKVTLLTGTCDEGYWGD